MSTVQRRGQGSDVRLRARAARRLRMTSPSWAGSDFQQPPRPGSPVALCGACRRLGACRLGLGREELQPDGSVHTELVCGPENEGGPEVAHGGWTAGAFDEVLGHVPVLHGELAVTGQLIGHLRQAGAGRAPAARPRLARAARGPPLVRGGRDGSREHRRGARARRGGDGGARLAAISPATRSGSPSRTSWPRSPRRRRHRSRAQGAGVGEEAGAALGAAALAALAPGRQQVASSSAAPPPPASAAMASPAQPSR